MRAQDGINGFGTGTGFIDTLVRYYEMAGYSKPDTYIAYETDHLRFSYDHARKAPLSSSSSGLQSLIPQFVHLDYLTDGQYRDLDRRISYEKKEVHEKYDNGVDMFFNFELYV